jgi:hypothetical protein
MKNKMNINMKDYSIFQNYSDEVRLQIKTFVNNPVVQTTDVFFISIVSTTGLLIKEFQNLIKSYKINSIELKICGKFLTLIIILTIFENSIFSFSSSNE